MRSILPRWHPLSRTALLLGALFIAAMLPRETGAQQPPDKPIFLAYTKPPTGTKRFQVDRVAGQVVFLPATMKGMFSAAGVGIALFDEQQRRVASAVSGERGEFEIRNVMPGVYTLVAGKETSQILSVPLQVRTDKPERTPVVSALLLKMRTKEDRHKTSVAPITNNVLRTELLERVTRDQAIRKEMIAHGVENPDKEIMARMAAIDAENLARMKEIVRQYHWPGPGLVGQDGAEAAFLMVQHAPHDFQKEMLPRVRSAYRAGDLQGQDYALLLDRVLVREGKPQVYGTQARPFSEWKNREPALDPIEDEAHVDQRRAEVGLFPLAEYRKMLKQMYFPERPGKREEIKD